jgi:hypothetical protein
MIYNMSLEIIYPCLCRQKKGPALSRRTLGHLESYNLQDYKIAPNEYSFISE